MRSKNTLGFLRIWELINNYGFDDEACAKLLEEHANGDVTVTPTVWISRTKARGLKVKRGKGGGVMAHSDIALDFQMWLDPNYRYHLIQFLRENRE